MTIAPTSGAAVESSVAKTIAAAGNTLSVIEEQVSTGQSISSPSQNPAQAVQMLNLESQLARAKQYTSNAQVGTGRLSLATSTLNTALSVLYQAQDALGSVPGVTASASIPGAVHTLTDARSLLLQLANTQYAGQAIFSGTGTPTRAYNTTGTYVGGTTVPTSRVASDTTVPVGTTGPAIFGVTAATEAAEHPKMTAATITTAGLLGKTGILATIIAQLKSGTSTEISKATSTGMAALQTAITRVVAQEDELGSSEIAMKGYVTQAKGVTSALTEQLSSVRDVTMAEAITNLQSQQTAYEAALYTASAINSDSLVKYLS